MKEKIISKRRGRGYIVALIDRFGNCKYALFDNNGDFVKENPNANALLKELWKY